MFTSKGVIQIAFIISGEKQALLRPNSSVHLPGFRCLLPDKTDLSSISFFCFDCEGINTSSSDVDVYITDIKFRQANPTLPSSITDRTNDPTFLT